MKVRPGITKLSASKVDYAPFYGVQVTATLDDGSEAAVPGFWTERDFKESVSPSSLAEMLFINLVDSLNDVIDMKYGMPPYDQETRDKMNQ